MCGTDVRWFASTFTRPSSCAAMPAAARSSRSPFEHAAGGDEEQVGLEHVPVVGRHADRVAFGVHRRQMHAGAYVDALTDLRRECGRDVGVEMLGEPVSAKHQRHLRPEGGEDVGELRGDVPAAEDRHARRHVVDAHDVVGGVVRHARVADQIRDGGARARGDDDAVGGDRLAGAQAQRVLVGELGVRLEQRRVRAALPVHAGRWRRSGRSGRRSGRAGPPSARGRRARPRRGGRRRSPRTRGRRGRRTSWSGCTRR